MKRMTIRPPRIGSHRRKQRWYSVIFLTALLLLVVLCARWLCPYDPNAQVFATLEPPSMAHPAGTDRYGRDLMSRILMGLQTSVLATLALVAMITMVGTAVGVAAGYWGGVVDGVLMRISDVCLAFPGLVFALAIAAMLGGGLQNAVLALALVRWPKYARLARSQTMAVRHTEYLAAAQLAGCTAAQRMIRHILPNILGSILVTAALDIGAMMMELAGLSFLGLGAKPPTAELGNMLSGGRSMLQTYPWVILAPGIALFLAVGTFQLLGDGVRDYLDPRSGKSEDREEWIR